MLPNVSEFVLNHSRAESAGTDHEIGLSEQEMPWRCYSMRTALDLTWSNTYQMDADIATLSAQWYTPSVRILYPQNCRPKILSFPYHTSVTLDGCILFNKMENMQY